MLPPRLQLASRNDKVPGPRALFGYKQPFVAHAPVARMVFIWPQRSVTAAAGQADSFAVSNKPYSQQLRHLRDVSAWIDLCEAHGPEFQGVDNFAAIRKLVELLRNPSTGMPAHVRQRISELADQMFQATDSQVAELDSSQQQVLVLELSQLGVVFISPEWHSCCPPVPVPLLNSLLDSLLQRLRTLRGGQVGVLLISLQRLQLCDSDAYSFILQEIERQLKFAKGDNSWYRQPDHLGKLVRGVVTVFLGIPRSIPRAQANSTLKLLRDAVTDLSDDMWGSDEWKSMASIVESFAEVPSSLGVSCTRMHDEIARRLVVQQPNLSGKVLSQLIAAYAAGPYADKNAVAALFTSITGRYDQQGAHTMADIAESLSAAGDVWGHEIKSMVSWALEAQNISNESGLRMLSAGARAGLITDSQWAEYYSRFATGAVDAPPYYTSSGDRECQLLLEAALHHGRAPDTVSKVCEQVATWMSKDLMRLWRIVPYMAIISSAPKHESDERQYSKAKDMIFDAAVRAVVKEVHPQMIMSQRGQLLMSALSASISASRKDAVDAILEIEGVLSYLQDQGEPVAHVLADAICAADIGSGAEAPAGSVWEVIMQQHKPLSQMTPINLSRLANALWRCLPPEVYLSALMDAAMVKLTGFAEDKMAIAHELQDVVRVVNQAKEIAQSEALEADTHEFLMALSSLIVGSGDSAVQTQPVERFTQSSVTRDMPYERQELAGMKMSALKEMLVEKDLPAGGNKSDMIERLLDPGAIGVSEQPEVADQAAQLHGMTVTQLKEMLAGRGLKVSGRKQDLIDRLLAEQGPPIPSDTSRPAADTGLAVVSSSADEELPLAPRLRGMENQDRDSSKADLADLTVADLKGLLRDNGLKVSGKKAELIERCIANGIHA